MLHHSCYYYYDVIICLFTGKEFTSIHRRCLLTPDLSEAISISKNKDPFGPFGVNPSNPPSLGLLIQHLRECTDGYGLSLESFQQYSKKLESPSTLSSEEVRQVRGHQNQMSTLYSVIVWFFVCLSMSLL